MALLGLIAFFVWVTLGCIGSLFTPLAWLSNPVEVSTIAFGVSFIISLMWCTFRFGKEIQLSKKHTLFYPTLIGFFWSVELVSGYQASTVERGCLELIPALLTILIYLHSKKYLFRSLKGILQLMILSMGIITGGLALYAPSGNLMSILLVILSLCMRTLRLILFKHATKKWVYPNFIAISVMFLASSLFTLPWTVWTYVHHPTTSKHIGMLFPEGTLAALFLLSQVTLLYHLPTSFEYIGLGIIRDVVQRWLVVVPDTTILQLANGIGFMIISILYAVPKLMRSSHGNPQEQHFWTLDDVATLEHLTDILNAYPSQLEPPSVPQSDQMSEISLN